MHSGWLCQNARGHRSEGTKGLIATFAKIRAMSVFGWLCRYFRLPGGGTCQPGWILERVTYFFQPPALFFQPPNLFFQPPNLFFQHLNLFSQPLNLFFQPLNIFCLRKRSQCPQNVPEPLFQHLNIFSPTCPKPNQDAR